MCDKNNTTTITGWVGSAPEVLATRTGNKLYAKFSVCVCEYWPDSRNVRRKTWFNCITFCPQLVKYVQRNMQKGSQVVVEGSMESHPYVDGNGAKKYCMKLHASEITVLTRQMLDVLREQERPSPKLRAQVEGFPERVRGEYLTREWETDYMDLR
jgi:single stranded DNA-binding protein